MTPRRSSGNKFRVFEFSEEDERVEKESKKLSLAFAIHDNHNNNYDNNGRKRHSSCSSFSSPVDKYKFLEFFAGDVEKKRRGTKFIDVDDEPVGVDDTTTGDTKRKKFDDRATNVDDGGIDKLKYSVYDHSGSEGQESLKSPNTRHRTVCTAFESFEDIFYPREDPDAVSISNRDVELLQPGIFVNDTIIDFYIKYLQSKISPDDQHRFHFFNSFFFRKLSGMNKYSDSRKGKTTFHHVYKWTRKVDIFKKDYIFIPVNYRLHWSLIVICYPGEVVYCREDESEISVKDPCILHMDSIKGSHKRLDNLVRRYLSDEWKQRHTETVDGVSSKFLQFPFIQLELPQQENSSDCGLFLLHYVELFLKEVSTNFSSSKLTKLSNFFTRDWFLPKEAYEKRAHIQQLIREILKNQSKNSSEKNSSSYSDTNDQGTGIELLGEKSSSSKACQGSPSSLTEMGIQISPSAVSLPKFVQISRPAWKSKVLIEHGTCASALSCGNYWQVGGCVRKSFMSPLQEAEEAHEQVSDSYFSEDLLSLDRGHGQQYIQLDESLDDNSSSGMNASTSSKSSEIGVDDCLLSEFERFDHSNESKKQEHSSRTDDLVVCVVEESEEANSTDSASYYDNIDDGNNHMLCFSEFCSIGKDFTDEPTGNGVNRLHMEFEGSDHLNSTAAHES